MKRPHARPMVGFANRRLHKRLEAERHLILISVANRIHGVLQDLSRHGARVSLREAPPQRGRDVLLRWGTHEAFGRVVWSRDLDVGIEFHTPMSPEALGSTIDEDVDASFWSGRNVP